MKLKGIFWLFILISCSFNSCSDDEDGGYSKLDNKEHLIELRVYSNTEGVPIMLQNGLIIKDYWESEFVTKEWFAQISARCLDLNVLMTGEIYVDGKLKAKSEANGHLSITYQVKGKGY